MKYFNDRLACSGIKPGTAKVLLVTLLSSVVIDVGAIWALHHFELGNAARIAVALSPVPGKIAVMRKEGDRLVLEPKRKRQSFARFLATLAPVEEAFPEIPELPHDPPPNLG